MLNNFFITTWDDGNKHDMYLASLLLEYDIPAIFFIPNRCKYSSLSEENILQLSKKGFEIGGHTVNHPSDLKLLTYEEQYKEIKDNKDWLEKIIGKQIDCFTYPRGRYNEDTIRAVKAAGYKYARTTLVLNTEKPADPYRIPTTIHAYPNRVEYNGRHWLEVAKELWDKAVKNANGYFHLFGHSWEAEENNVWEQLEEFFKYIKK